MPENPENEIGDRCDEIRTGDQTARRWRSSLIHRSDVTGQGMAVEKTHLSAQGKTA